MRILFPYSLLAGLLTVIGCGPVAHKEAVAQPVATANRPGRIPIDPARWYQVNNVTSGLDGLFDGVVGQSVNTGSGKLLPTYEAYYRLLPGEQMTIRRIRLYDGAGSNADAPVTLSIITESWQRVPIATFLGTQNGRWVGPDPAQPDAYDLNAPILNARYLLLTTSGAYPDELELTGTWRSGTAEALAPARTPAPFAQMMGVNGFEWNVEEAAAPWQPDEARVAALRNFPAFRHYLDWDKIEPEAGKFTYNPAASGSWNYDAMYARLKAETMDVLTCFKTTPDWLQATYPANQRDHENIPAPYGSELRDPASYMAQARAGFQFMARYGYNTAVSPALVTVSPNTTWAGTNVVKIGLGLIRYIECNNETDRTWKGRQAYQSGREYAANLSAFYDGHKNTMGAGVGVKNADPTVTVVAGGLSGISTDYLRAMIDWCREFRGYRADGRVNLCWDVLNQHFYGDDYDGAPVSGGARGVAPERSGLARVAAGLVSLSRQEAGGIPVWITETGFDQNGGSPIRAIAIGPKSVAETQADWTLRTALLLSRAGVERLFFYQLYDYDPQSAVQFSSMGLLNADKSPKPAGQYLFQTRTLLGAYRFAESLPATGILVDRYEPVTSGGAIYALVVPDETGRTATYQLAIPAGKTATLRKPVIGQTAMSSQALTVTNGFATVPVTETPSFVVLN